MRTYTELTQALFHKQNEAPQTVALPHTWNNLDGQDGGGDYYRGTGIYQIQLPDPTPNKRQYIEFQGANHVATVYCNDIWVGEHKGGFSTFRFELTDMLHPTNNQLRVEVFNGECEVYPQRADFTFFGGLYRTVTFIEVEQAHFDLLKDGSDAVFVTPRSTGNTRLDVFTVDAQNHTVAVEITDALGNTVASETVEAAAHTTLHLQVNEPHLWQGVKDPYLYTAQVRLYRSGETVDEIQIQFGYRSFHICPNTGFYLNGNSTPLHGVCRHQDRKDMGWAISRKEHEEDARLIQEVGANTVRLAHYQHDQYFYDLCDKMGFVVWAEIPMISKFMEGTTAYDNAVSQMTELIAQCYNHPSICLWGICNEITIGGYSEELLKNMQDLHTLCKRMDPSRLTTVAHLSSVPVNSDHVYVTDVQSYNYYLGWYVGTVEQNGERMDAWHKANPDIPYGISEYGADHYPCWHSAAPFNHDYTEEYALFYHHEMLKTFEKRPYLWATHLWNMFDFAADARDEGGFKGINAKGIITYDRRLKKDTFYLYKAFWNPEPMVHICGRRFADRAPDERNVTVVTNEPAVTLSVNGQLIATKQVSDYMAVFENVVLTDGSNTLTVTTDHATDTITLNAVAKHNTDYDLPDLVAAVNAGNWFEEQTEEGQLENHYTVQTPIGLLLDNDRCQDLMRGWIMSLSAVPLAERMTLIYRFASYKVQWRDRHLATIINVEKYDLHTEWERLDRMLRRVKKPAE